MYSSILKTSKIVTKSSYNHNDDRMIGYRKLRYFGHINKLFMSKGNFTKITKKDIKKVKEYL
eukprot:CAMPEP_0170521304 /NCGR_PEP_ID=MMETSP0209-20121228/6622_1 /TAXON_ID=665100 ORGANISM="Litonotus pictus, Strain P1" /NCGR_SAMPLE_ID=MMETSP0209 /ASSEMBLY_ACC=CAM_ASM_000301 /LENGTH=61 /DNA_ID=CAMNT_0010808065 /DNA_START=551 /DNA_END=733 /DNA_ORIENTATION=-